MDKQAPIELDFQSVQRPGTVSSIRTFTSYNFDRNILVPASPFRFSAPGIDKSARTAIRSCDLVTLWCVDPTGQKQQIGTGIIDETDTHIVPTAVDYILTGRDTMAQLVDNDAVDKDNRIINTTNANIETILATLIKNTRIPQGYKLQQVPNGQLLFQTSPGETKINALQRYLEFTNCLVWSNPQGQVILGKPNFTQKKQGDIVISSSDPKGNNVLEARVRRNLNQAIRSIITQLQTLDQVDANAFTIGNNDTDMRRVAGAGGGRSVYRRFSYGQGNDAINQIQQVGNQSGNPQAIGAQLSAREIARDNMKILDVEVVARGHINDAGIAYNVDQIYGTHIDDDDVSEDLYVYSCSWEMTMEHGMLTRMRLCRLGTICAYADALQRQA